MATARFMHAAIVELGDLVENTDTFVNVQSQRANAWQKIVI